MRQAVDAPDVSLPPAVALLQRDHADEVIVCRGHEREGGVVVQVAEPFLAEIRASEFRLDEEPLDLGHDMEKGDEGALILRLQWPHGARQAAIQRGGQGVALKGVIEHGGANIVRMSATPSAGFHGDFSSAAPALCLHAAMSSDTESNTTPDLDGAVYLPAQHRRSYVAMLAVQALNAFNDNFVKLLLVAFAGVVAKGTDLGTSLQLYLGAIFSIPYILFAPVAGWLSDRCSKQRVIFWMQVVQVLIFAVFLGALLVHDAQPTLLASLGCFFLLATQAAFFSPAKMGILKELVGSRRLGSASGMLQLTNFVGILAGMGLAGKWFGWRLEANGGDAWGAVWTPMVVVTIVAIVQIFGSLLIQRTPAHTDLRFHRGVWVEHFAHIKLLFSSVP